MSVITCSYKGSLITVSRTFDHENWYITVTFPDGTYGYDGWWRDSEFKSADEAIAEAKIGAQLDKEST